MDTRTAAERAYDATRLSPAPENTDAIIRILAELPADLPLLPEEEAVINLLLAGYDPWGDIVTALLD